MGSKQRKTLRKALKKLKKDMDTLYRARYARAHYYCKSVGPKGEKAVWAFTEYGAKRDMMKHQFVYKASPTTEWHNGVIYDNVQKITEKQEVGGEEKDVLTDYKILSEDGKEVVAIIPKAEAPQKLRNAPEQNTKGHFNEGDPIPMNAGFSS